MKFGEAITSGKRTSHTAQAGKEKRRIALLTLALLVVGTAYVVGEMQKEKQSPYSRGLPMPEELIPEEVLALPEIDVARLEALVDDSSREARVSLERDALDVALGQVRRIVERQYEALGLTSLDRQTIATALGDTTAARGRAYRARGWIEKLRTRPADTSRPEEHQGILLLEDQSVVYFVTPRLLPGGADIGDFVRLDGLFLKAFTDELPGDEPGTTRGWVDGPLIVASGMQRSFPKREVIDADGVAGELAFVTDDGLQTGITGLEERPLWALMNYAHAVEQGQVAPVDWDAAPELNKLLLQEVLLDGSDRRGQPFRIPVSKLQAISVTRAEENPLRLEHVTRGWIGNTTWTDVIQFHLPDDAPDLAMQDLVSAQGFFLKNVSYEPRDGGLRKAPFFVLSSLTKYVPPTDPSLQFLLWGVGVMVIGGIAGFVFLASRDRKQTARLQADLVRRRRARRGAAQSEAMQPGGSSA